VTRRDLLQEWLCALPPWDQVPRLATWLTDVAGVEPTPYGQDVSRLLPTSMVYRAMEPGCICRHVVILEGPEEWAKSTLVQELASEPFYVVLSMGLETKDSHLMLQGSWVAEMAELDSLSRTEETRLKAFLTMRADSYIPKYSNFRESHPRRTVFIGTTNTESDYLKGISGNTRFLPVKITKPIDIAGFMDIREQLFAEALVVYQSGAAWWQLSPEGAEAAKDERERRRVINVYEDTLEQWLEAERFTLVVFDANNQPIRFVPGETSWQEIARWCLKLETPAAWKDKSLQMQIAQALKTLGWRLMPTHRQGQRIKLWVKTA
jgi:predicted P-loop ATPase